MSIALFIFMFLLIWNPLYWPQQIARHLNTSLIITPDAPEIQQLNGSSAVPGTFWYHMNQTYGINATAFYNNYSEVEQLYFVENYTLEKIEFKYLIEVYGVIDYVATPAEVLARNAGDCQSRTVVMTSFLIYLGYDAWAVETPFHWYSRVYLQNGSYIYLYRNNRTDPIVRMNHQQIIFEMNVFESILLVLQHYRINEPINSIIWQPLSWIFIIPISFLIAFLFVLLIKTSGVSTSKKRGINTLFGGTLFNLGFLTMFGLSSLYPPISMLILIITIVLVVQLISHNFFMAPEGVDLESRKK
jgi:hypothetical protein